MKPYSLLCRVPPQDGTTRIGNEFADYTSRYRRSIRWQGGFWEASWVFLPDMVDMATMREWFENRLMFRLDERAGGVISWQGVIWEMTLSDAGYKERLSVADVFNAVKAIYTDASTGNATETSWYTDDESISRYLRRELVVDLDNVSTSQAEETAQATLAQTAWPIPECLDIDPGLDDQLSVTAVGDIFTANNRYVTAAVGSTYSERINNILATDCDLLTAGRTAGNSSVPEDLKIRRRAWDAMLDLTEMGGNNMPWRIWCDVGGRVNYEAADNEPGYFWRGKTSGFAGTQSPWLMRPGVVRNLHRRHTEPAPGSFLQSGRDNWVLEVEMADGRSFPRLKPAGVTPDNIEAMAKQYETWLDMERDANK